MPLANGSAKVTVQMEVPKTQFVKNWLSTDRFKFGAMKGGHDATTW